MVRLTRICCPGQWGSWQQHLLLPSGQASRDMAAGQALIYRGIIYMNPDRQPHRKEYMPDSCITLSFSKLSSVNYDKESLARSRHWKKKSMF